MQRFCPTAFIRPARTILAVMLLFSVALPIMTASGARAGSDEDDPLDIAAMALRPADLGAEDLEGYGLGNSILTEDPEAASDFFGLWRVDDDDVRADGFDEADPDRTYIVNLMRPAREGDPTRGTAAVVRPYILAFADDETAEDGFAILADAWQGGGLEEAELDAEIGDESILVTGTGYDAQEPNDFAWSDLLFRVDNIVAGVSVEAYTVELPDHDVVAALAERQVERIEEALDDGAPDLSTMVLRLDLPADAAIFDQYEVLDSEPFYSAYETLDEFEDRLDVPAELGMIAMYNLQQQIGGTAFGPIEPPVAFYYVRIVEFEDEDAASDYLEDRVDRLLGTVDDVEEVDSVSNIADEAVGLVYQHMTGNVTFDDYRIYARVGTFYVTMAINTTEALDTDALDELFEQQADCVAGEASCHDPVRLPDDLDVSESQI